MGKKVKTKKKEVFFPGTESREVFLAALTLAKELVASGGITVQVDRDGDARLFIDGRVLKELPDNKFSHGLTRDLFKTLIGTELSAFIRATIYSEPREGIKREFPEKVLTKLGRPEMDWRLKKIKETLVPYNLKERVTLRQTSKASVLDGITWELAIKKQDEIKGVLDEIPYATLCISYASPLISGPALRIRSEEGSLEIPMVSEPKQLNLELHQADIEEMIKILSLVRDNLVTMRSER